MIPTALLSLVAGRVFWTKVIAFAKIYGMRKIREGPRPRLVRAFRENRIDLLEAAFRKAFDADSPYEMLSVVCELLASTFLGYIQEKELPLPDKHTVGSLWNIVKQHLEIDVHYAFDFLRPNLETLAKGFPSVVQGVDRLVELNRTGQVAGFEPVLNLYEHRLWHIKLFAHAAQTLVLYLVEIKQGWIPF